MEENESVGPEQSTPATAEAEVYEGLRSAGLGDMEAFRTAQAIRELAGRNIKETLEVHQGKMDARVDGVETRLTAKIDRGHAELKAESAQLRTELSSELEAIRKELNFYRWGFIVGIGLVTLLIAIMSFLVASGLLPVFERWLWQDSTPSQSVQAPDESDPPETAVPPESNPPEPSPQ